MYKKFRINYKMNLNDRGNALPLCIDGESLEDINNQVKEVLRVFRENPIEAKDTHGNPLHGFGKIPYSVSIT